MAKENKKVFFENKGFNLTVEEKPIVLEDETEQPAFIVRHNLKEMCPTTDKSLALIYAKGYERGLAEGKKLVEK